MKEIREHERIGRERLIRDKISNLQGVQVIIPEKRNWLDEKETHVEPPVFDGFRRTINEIMDEVRYEDSADRKKGEDRRDYMTGL